MSTNDNLVKRLKAEENFHDQKYSENDSLPSHYKLQPTALLYEDMKEIIGELNNKHVLEYGCGDGWITVDLACRSKWIDTFDISTTAIERTMEQLKNRGLDKYCNVKKMSAEVLDYSDNAFDIVFGFAILHHLDLKIAIDELYRVMKPGARAVFAEPLGTNPILNLYRRATPQFRTKDEEPLDLKKFKKMLTHFSTIDHKEYYLLSLFPLALSNIKVFSQIALKLFNLCKIIDRYLLCVPFLRPFAWYSIIVIKK